MHKPSRPRTPRYWPRMKVRGARRKRQRHIYAIQRFGDASTEAFRTLEVFFVTMGKHLEHARVTNITDYISTDGVDLKEDHAEH